jgi:hypothetical protein
VGLPPELSWPVRVDPGGRTGPTPRQARGAAWRRTSRGLYVPSAAPRTVEQRIVEAAAVLPAYGGITGWAALRWLGGAWYDGTWAGGRLLRDVVLATNDSSVRPQPGIAISEERIPPELLQAHAGLRTTTATYALLFEIRHARTVDEAVIHADMAAFSDLVSRAELGALVGACAGWTGIGRGREVVDLMDENAWSPTEVSMRRVWTRDAGLPRPLCNRPVFGLDGRLLGTPDLLDPVAGVAGEYDSELHLERARRRRDVERESMFRGVGLEPVVMLTDDLADPWRFVGRLRDAYSRAASRPVSARRWTIATPPWWTPTLTVDQRRALTEDQRAGWLRHRRRAG